MVGLRRSGFSSTSSLSVCSHFSRKQRNTANHASTIHLFPVLFWVPPPQFTCTWDWCSWLILLGCTNLSGSFALGVFLNNPAVKGFSIPMESLPASQSPCCGGVLLRDIPQRMFHVFPLLSLMQTDKIVCFWSVYDELITYLVAVHTVHQGRKKDLILSSENLDQIVLECVA